MHAFNTKLLISKLHDLKRNLINDLKKQLNSWIIQLIQKLLVRAHKPNPIWEKKPSH